MGIVLGLVAVGCGTIVASYNNNRESLIFGLGFLAVGAIFAVGILSEIV